MTPTGSTVRVFLILLALVLFAVAAYLSPTVGDKLTRLAFAAVILAWLL